jgi:hypothetical protein
MKIKRILFLFLIIISINPYKIYAITDNNESREQATDTTSYSSLNSIIHALYKAVDFKKGETPDWKSFTPLFIKNANLVSVKDDKYLQMSPDDFVQRFQEQVTSGLLQNFTEKEIHRITEQFGNIVHVFSTYQSDYIMNDKPHHVRGINSIQLIIQKGHYKVLSIMWYEEDASHKIPDKYLPATNNI